MNHVLAPAPKHDAGVGPGGRPRVAVISTYDELCGIAGYTRALVRQLEARLDLEVFDLDQYLLRAPYAPVQKMGDRHIQEIAARLGAFDSVNIQLEHGTLGGTALVILKRLRWLLEAAPRLSITFHTVFRPPSLPVEEVWGNLRQLKPGGAVQVVSDSLREAMLGARLYRMLARLQDRKPVRVITHTRRDRRMLQDVYGIREAFDHPLSFLDAARAREIRATTTRAQFPALRGLPPDARLFGTFGFLSPYKGFETAIRALKQLPPDHHLLIFGGVHPNSIRRNQPLDPYVKTLLGEAHLGQTVFDVLAGAASKPALQVGGEVQHLFGDHPQSLAGRVHFIGALRDEEFMSAMAVCDAVLLPYVEVGQSSSGPISIALDMGCRVIASRTAAFLQLARYHPDAIEFFDIGNHSELALRMKSPPAHDPLARKLAFTTATNAEVYVAANAVPAAATVR